ncbi:DNA polymerase domain-containing protein [Rubellicoccus peritrichatus]|uniref:DNA-directed DNA polymerase n=1 Tax=Rubellicoccus peritrichatus TaxID=3080537 RepID=A0AAQ3L5X3_9BACT|nr:DNA polymerase domain-containing protein [Puniceicoccus sp. CR14]WOO39830.1 DNA polymerase domain-containing protein [Puniceicoccus sp. CR14]
MLRFENPEAYTLGVKERKGVTAVEAIRPLEHQWLLEQKARLFGGMRFDEIRRCQLDIETYSSIADSFPDPDLKEDRVLAIGLRYGGESHYLVLAEKTDDAERELLKSLNTALAEADPDVIEGHNIFKFDLDYLKRRCKRLKVPCAWGRYGQKAKFRNSRLRIAERWVDYPRCDLPGRTVFDTYLMIQLFDITTRELPSYTLKDVARYLKVTTEKDERTYLAPAEIQETFDTDRDRFLAYLGDDLRETEGIAGLLLPTYVAQAKNFPMNLQEICLRGTAAKVDSLFLEKYFHAGAALPQPPEVSGYAGAFTKSFHTGVFHHVLHYDVASLYPSLLLHIGRNPVGDSLGVFIPMLEELRAERLHYKTLARETDDPVLKREFTARQASYKIVINSFYGYLGFPGARFADSELAAEVTAKGRDLLQKLITEFEKHDCKVLEADTDGIYLSSEKDWKDPEALLDKVKRILPAGIDLEFDGSYESMFCYKSKNYALYDGEKISIAGSALRSRGIEPFLKELSDTLIHHLLGAGKQNPSTLENDLRNAISQGDFPIHRLAKREYLSQNPEAYQKAVETGGKSRRASLEVALRMDPQPRMGEQVSYYITTGDKKRSPDWQVARPVADYNPEAQPYDPTYYLRKLDEWRKRYAEFLEPVESSIQGELF